MRTLKKIMALALIAASVTSWAQAVYVPQTTNGDKSSGVVLQQTAAGAKIFVGRGGVISSVPRGGNRAISQAGVGLASVLANPQDATVKYYKGPSLSSPNISSYLTDLVNGTLTNITTITAGDIIANTNNPLAGYVYYRVVLTNLQGIILRDYILDQDDNSTFNGVPQHLLRVVQDMANFDYDIYRPGTRSDGTKITSGANTQVATEIVIIGVCISFTGDTPAAYDNSVRYINMQSPAFTLTTTVSARGTTGSSNTVIAKVPLSTAVTTPASIRLAMTRGGVINVSGLNNGASQTIYSSPTINGPWTQYTSVFGPNGTATFTVPTTSQSGFFR